MKKLGLILLGAPIGYLLLMGYLAAKIRPVPIVLLSAREGDDDRPLESLAA